jgi:hypothetical protein
MAQTDFEFGFNALNATPSYDCMGRAKCEACGKFHGYCSELLAVKEPRDPIYTDPGVPCEQWERQNMDLSKERSSKKGREKFENRDWIDSQKDLPKKGGANWRIDSAREAKKNKTGILLFIDITSGSKKRVMSLRKGFTLDAFCDELGPNTDKWIGKSIKLERGGNEGQYVNVSQ